MALKEALIIVPQFSNDGKPLGHVKSMAKQLAIHAFGGATVMAAEGSWLSDSGELMDEPVWLLSMAAPVSQEAVDKLANIADFIGREARQLAMYVKYPDQTVDIRDTSTLWQPQLMAAE